MLHALGIGWDIYSKDTTNETIIKKKKPDTLTEKSMTHNKILDSKV